MPKIVVICHEKDWTPGIEKALSLVKEDETLLLVMDEGVKRCIVCEPELFRLLHQFILDGGKALVCLSSLKKAGIPPTRPPEIFERIEDGRKFLEDANQNGFEIVKACISGGIFSR